MTNPMTDERRRANMAYWKSGKAVYPFRAQAPTLEPSPTDVLRDLPDLDGWFDAISVSGGITYWGFSTAAGRDAFLETYPQATELAAEAVFGNPV